jgi:hypothetical protein
MKKILVVKYRVILGNNRIFSFPRAFLDKVGGGGRVGDWMDFLYTYKIKINKNMCEKRNIFGKVYVQNAVCSV